MFMNFRNKLKNNNYLSKQLSSETPYSLTNKQMIITAIATVIIMLPFLMYRDGILSQDMFVNTIVFLIFYIFIILLPILFIFVGNLVINKLLHLFSHKYHIHLFPLFLSLCLLSLFIVILCLLISNIHNYIWNIENTLLLVPTFFMPFLSLFFLSKVITKHNNSK